jgi:hypothetical protein
VQQEELLAFQSAVATRYHVERELGHGGMATVFLAQDLKHGRPVALKVLRPEIAAMLGPKRFQLEIEIAARLNHPNILPLYDSDQASDTLFYVMPYVEGGTLQSLVAKGATLRVGQALDLARQIAAGLSYAHARDVVHRDIKPANILLASGHVFIADFGIARAVRQAVTDERLTDSGLAIGTPAYMAPEQLRGSSSVDGRADEYSLACVLYEMLVGALPPMTETKGDIRKAIRAVRKDVPPAVEDALERALATERGTRYPSVAEFSAVLDSTAATPPDLRARIQAHERRIVRKLVGGAALVMGAVVLGWWALKGGNSPFRLAAAAPPDTTRYAILPFERQAGVTLNEAQLLHDALDRWTGVSIVDHAVMRDALGSDTGALTVAAGNKLARQVGAGRYVRGELSPVGDSVRVHASLYDIASNSVLTDKTIKVGGANALDPAFAGLVDGLLFRGAPPAEAPGVTGKRSLPSRQAFTHGQQAMESWDLPHADSAFTTATTFDPQYAEAQLWVALTRAWSRADSARWRVPAEQAVLGRARLAPNEQVMADAVLTQAKNDFGAACPMWERLTQRAPQDYAAWYGSAFCQATDAAVVPDRRSPSAWSFRTSQHHALAAYQRAFRLRPAILASFHDGSYASLRRLLMVDGNSLRMGRTLAPDTALFVADPAWLGDSLALVPYSHQAGASHQLTTQAGPRLDALRHQRTVLTAIAQSWVTTFPQSADALEVLAISLAIRGDPSALDTLRRARALVRAPDEAFRVAWAEIWMEIGFGIPARMERVRTARQLADSLLREQPPGGTANPALLAGLATLTGRANLAATYYSDPRAAEFLGLSPSLRGIAPALLVYGALGGPVDTIVALEQRVRSAIAGLTPKDRDGATQSWLLRPLTLAFPAYRMRAPNSSGGHLVDLQAALAAGDSIRARRGLSEIHNRRQGLVPADVTIDALYPEAQLLADLHDFRGAAAWLDPTLSAQSEVTPHNMGSPARAACLVRAMALRARLAAQLGDRAHAAQWANAVLILWSDADPFLQDVVRQMRQLAS